MQENQVKLELTIAGKALENQKRCLISHAEPDARRLASAVKSKDEKFETWCHRELQLNNDVLNDRYDHPQ